MQNSCFHVHVDNMEYGPKEYLNHVTNTEKRLRFREVQLKERKIVENDTTRDQEMEEVIEKATDNQDFVSKLHNSQSNIRKRGPYKLRKNDVFGEAANEELRQDTAKEDRSEAREDTEVATGA